MSTEDLILLDTCVLMANPDIVHRVHQKGGTVFITNTVLDELDYNKKGTESHNESAKRILRELNSNGVRQVIDAENIDALERDVLSSSTYNGIPVNIIHRDRFNSNSNNDAKIIEIAKDYSLTLISADQGMVVRAQSAGIKAYYWHGKDIACFPAGANQPNKSPENSAPSSASNAIKPFSVHKGPITQPPEVLKVARFPTEGDSVKTSSGKLVRLRSTLSEGGEGKIFLTDDSAVVCKIYRPDKLTNLKRDKIKLMLTRSMRTQGIAWPIDIVTNAEGEFCGYIMPKARGIPMQPTIFVKPHFEKKLPAWKRRDLAKVCLRFLDLVKTLHDANVLVGDINPLNVLINPDSTDVWLVDTDSFQIENYPCPVGTVHFTAPEIQGQDYGRFLRTTDHELFAVATMLFAILMCGKYPYSQQGGGTAAENVRNKVFPYPFHKSTAGVEHRGTTAPSGPYRYMWSHLPYQLKEAFHDSFREGNRVPIDQWIRLIGNYLAKIERGSMSDDLFPKQEKITDGVETSCGSCGTSFSIQRSFLAELELAGKRGNCPSCKKQIQLRALAKKAAMASTPGHSSPSKSPWHVKNNPGSVFSGNVRSNRPSAPRVPIWSRGGSNPSRIQAPPSPTPAKNKQNAFGIAFLVVLIGIGYAFAGVAGVIIVLLALAFLAFKNS